MSKRNITFTRPEEPNFLKRIKEQIGYKEGPTVDTKRENLGPAEDFSDDEEEQPQVVVLKEGDLTAEEVEREKDRLEKEATEARADLNAPIVFKSKKKTEESSEESQEKPKTSKRAHPEQPREKSTAKKVKSKALLSFDEEEDDD